ncbi:HdeD family acid-resistance protein [Paracoccaceae bacterium GXU_MW_L88]
MESKRWWIVLGLGILSIVTGIIALINPFAASLAATTIAAVGFLIVGGVSAWAAWGESWWTVATGILAVLLGLAIMINPIAGMASLTLMVGFLIAMMGGVRIAAAFKMRPNDNWVIVLISGLVSLLLAAMILLNFPASALTILGIFLGIDLMMNGMFLSVFGYALRPGDDFHPEDVFPGIDKLKEEYDERRAAAEAEGEASPETEDDRPPQQGL